jgi:hypothetical protein
MCIVLATYLAPFCLLVFLYSFLPSRSCRPCLIPGTLPLELSLYRLLVGMLYIGLIYQMEYIGPVRALTRELYTLAFLRPSPLGSDTKSSPFGSFVGL